MIPEYPLSKKKRKINDKIQLKLNDSQYTLPNFEEYSYSKALKSQK